MENNTIRVAARIAGIPFWRIALKIGVSEPTLTRWLRMPLSAEREALILSAIKELEKEVR